jgi:hypothetical protein
VLTPPLQRALASAEPLAALGLGGPVDPSEPQQVHLALTGNGPTEMHVMWVTKAHLAMPAVWFAPHDGPGNGTQTLLPATTTTYTVPLSYYNPSGWVGWIHAATLRGLQPGRKYDYQVGNTDAPSDAKGRLWTFTAARQPAADAETDFAIFGDQGTDMPLGFKVGLGLAPSRSHARQTTGVHTGLSPPQHTPRFLTAGVAARSHTDSRCAAHNAK